MTVLGIIILVSIIVVLVFPRIAQRRVLGAREDIPDQNLTELFGLSSLPPETILTILKQIGASYGIAYSKLRPSDCFISQLSKIDSWHFDAGAETLEKYLRSQFGLAIPSNLRQFTILDLIKFIESDQRKT